MVTGNNVAAEDLPPFIDALLAKRRVLLWLETLPRATTSLLRSRYRVELLRPPMLAEITRPGS